MPINRDKVYNLLTSTFIFGPVNISGFGDDGAIEYVASSENDMEVIGGYDGTSTPNAILDWALIAEVKVREGSSSYKALGALLQLQRQQVATGQPVTRYPWFHADSSNGDQIQDTDCLFVAGPTLTKTNRYSVRSFKILIPNGKRNMIYGALNE